MHPSILPFYRGPAPLIRQLECGDKIGGISIIELHPFKFDMGRTFLQWMYRIPDDMLCEEFNEASAHHGAHAIIQVLDKYDNYMKNIKSQKDSSLPLKASEVMPELSPELKLLFNNQNFVRLPQVPENMEVLPYDLLTNKKRPTYARMLKPNDGDIDWENNSNIQVYNKWRAFGKKPGCFNYMPWPIGSTNKKRVKIIEVKKPEIVTLDGNNENFELPGTVQYSKEKKVLEIRCKNDIIECTKIQVEGKKPIDALTFFNGYLSAYPKRITRFSKQS